MAENAIKDKTYNFAIRIIKLYKYLTNNKEYILAKQILRCGTSIGANVEEAIGGQSKKEFISKMSVAYKEARESYYWLKLLNDTNYIENKTFITFEKDIQEILRLLIAIQKTASNNLKTIKH